MSEGHSRLLAATMLVIEAIEKLESVSFGLNKGNRDDLMHLMLLD